MKYFDAVVVGAGLAGSTAARTLAEQGRKVLIVELHRHIAGHCHDAKNEAGITIHTYGPHIFHTTNEDVWDFVQRFTDFHYFQHRVLSYVDGRFIPFPIQADTINELFGMSISTAEVAAFLAEEVRRSKFQSPPQTFRDAVVSQVGERFYSIFLRITRANSGSGIRPCCRRKWPHAFRYAPTAIAAISLTGIRAYPHTVTPRWWMKCSIIRTSVCSWVWIGSP